MATFNSWKDIFEIERRDAKGTRSSVTEFLMGFWTPSSDSKAKRFYLIDKQTREVVGQYYDLEYTINRAKFKFKRRMRAVDRLLLGH